MCTIEGCKTPIIAKGYCQMHYRRFRLYGDPNFVQKKQRSVNTTSRIILKIDYAEVELTKEKFALVDLEDIQFIEGFNWYFSNTTGYAYSNIIGTSMQQYLIGKAPDGHHIDHDDRNKLNNRRKNLIFKTYSGNAINSDRSDTATGYSFHKTSGKFQVFTNINTFNIYLGLYITESEAIEIAEKAKQLRKEHKTAKSFKIAWKLMRRAKADTEKRDE